VAVKRMLRTYDSSASNEIDLLVRTDNHPNLIRYFIKEQKGEFVYLALEKVSGEGRTGTAYDVPQDEMIEEHESTS
jgi:serine/threonine protein kinase